MQLWHSGMKHQVFFEAPLSPPQSIQALVMRWAGHSMTSPSQENMFHFLSKNEGGFFSSKKFFHTWGFHKHKPSLRKTPEINENRCLNPTQLHFRGDPQPWCRREARRLQRSVPHGVDETGWGARWRVTGDHSNWRIWPSGTNGKIYPLVNIQKTIENGPVEIVDLPINSILIFHSFLFTFTISGIHPSHITESTPSKMTSRAASAPLFTCLESFVLRAVPLPPVRTSPHRRWVFHEFPRLPGLMNSGWIFLGCKFNQK